MDEVLGQLVEAYQGMSAEEIYADMQEAQATEMFADAWLVASFVAYRSSGV